jgi:hypothetical protein
MGPTRHTGPNQVGKIFTREGSKNTENVISYSANAYTIAGSKRQLRDPVSLWHQGSVGEKGSGKDFQHTPDRPIDSRSRGELEEIHSQLEFSYPSSDSLVYHTVLYACVRVYRKTARVS